jgi:hypothetical protein
MLVLIQVKEEHTDYSKMIYGHTDCMVVNAVQAVFPNKKIDCGYCYLGIDDKDYLLPEFVTKNIEKFMNREKVEPFEFELDLDNPCR